MPQQAKSKLDYRLRLWSSLSLAALVGTGVVSGCSATANSDGSAASGHSKSAMSAAVEGGEGEGAFGDVSLASNDVAYLTQLGLMRGHLLMGIELYRAGHIEHARTHMKHPKNELYADLVPAFSARGTAGFAPQLTALSGAVGNDNSTSAQVEAAYADVLKGISEAESRVSSATDAAARLQVVVNLLRTAADEYALGVVDHQVVNAHEYQDSLGFTRTADAMVDAIDAGGNQDLSAALAQVKVYIASLYHVNVWPGIMPPETVTTDASLLYGAAARIEIVALGLS